VQKGVYIAKGGNILEYRTKANAFSKPKSNHPLTTLVLQLVQMFKHKLKKEETLPLEIYNKVQEELVFAYKKCLTKHGSQTIKQVLK
jgi:hypothetical protein